MATWSLDYALPVSAVRLSGTRTITTDRVGNGGELSVAESAEGSAELIVIADDRAPGQVRLKHGPLFQVHTALAFTDDGRLTSAAGEPGGAATLAKAILTVAPAITGIVHYGESDVLLDDGDEPVPAEDPPTLSLATVYADPVQKRYAQAHPTEWDLIDQYTKVAQALERSLADLFGRVLDVGHPAEHLAEIRRVRLALQMSRDQLSRLDRHFKAWRAAQVTSRTEKHDYVMRIDDIAGKVSVSSDGVVRLTGSAGAWGSPAREAWQRLGLVVEVIGESQKPKKAENPPPKRGVWIRAPRYLQLRTWRRREGTTDQAELVNVERCLVVDRRSPLRLVRFKSSLWSRRTVNISVNGIGTLSAYSYAGSSVAAGPALPGLEAPEPLLAGPGLPWLDPAAQREADHERRLARTIRQLELRQADLEQAGLAATEEDYAELSRLQEQKQLLESRAGGAAAEAMMAKSAMLAALRSQREGRGAHEEAPAA